MKPKFIYECVKTDSGLVKNKYRIVYENKTYYYAKAYGSDILQKFLKGHDNVMNYHESFWSLEDFNITNRLFDSMESNDLLVRMQSSVRYNVERKSSKI